MFVATKKAKQRPLLAIACRDAGMPLLSGTDNGPAPRHSNIPVHQKRPLLNRPAGTRLRRYEIQPEADRFGFTRHVPVPHPPGNLRLCKSAILPICLPQLPISPLPAGTQVCRCCRELTTANGSTLRAFFSLYFIGLEREFGAILMVLLPFQAFQKATRSPTKLSLSTVGTCLQAIF
ncbi:MAG: hypothetical protein ACJAWL_000358 [Motiliproteus sp.]